jgi:septal ring factor EnvC (AmiA/AmiB activator)
MIIRTVAAMVLVRMMTVALIPGLMRSGPAMAQDVPGIEICTVEKTMERRTSCLQSNVNFLQTTITKLASDSQQKLDAANRQIEALKSAVASLQKRLDDVQAAQKNNEQKNNDMPLVKDATPPAPPTPPAPAKEGAK